jgi:prepilin-type N-terminal cleavage/methylation domain-containing protein
MRPAAGVTLMELMVVLVLLGLMAGVVGLAWRPDSGPATDSSSQALMARARHEAALAGHRVAVEIVRDGDTLKVVALPDGRLVGGP